jgi:hypothetical protein
LLKQITGLDALNPELKKDLKKRIEVLSESVEKGI